LDAYTGPEEPCEFELEAVAALVLVEVSVAVAVTGAVETEIVGDGSLIEYETAIF
jgi:hypothetical protein